MQYAQITDGLFARQLDESQAVEWDANNYCTPAALVKDGKAEQFGVVPLLSIPAPSCDPISQRVMLDGAELVDGQWQYKWAVVDLPPEQVAANQAAAAAAIKASIINATQQRLDAFALTRNYDGILSLCTYATDANPRFAIEGQYGVQSRSATWAALYQIMDEVAAGTRPVPSGYADVEPDLPALEWPQVT